MINPWRLLAAAALNVVLGSGIAAAQSVMVRNAPAGEAIEVVLNASKVASGTADTAGDVTLPLDINKNIGKPEIDANIFVDVCDKLHRIIVVERAKLPDPQQPGCARRDIAGLYWVRPVNTLVVDVGGATPSMLLVKGTYNPSTPHDWKPSPKGLVVFGGGTYENFRDAVNNFCGGLSGCSGKSSGFGFTGGVTYWVTPVIAGEVTYLKPHKATAQATSDTFSFNSSLDAQAVLAGGKIGIPIGPVRLYGHGGGVFHKATSTTTETIDGASQTLEFKTDGWNWYAGGGGEVWMGTTFGLYADLTFVRVSGDDKAGGEGRLDELLRTLAFGARIHIGR